MNIIEAVKSGKRFKRKSWRDYLDNDQNFCSITGLSFIQRQDIVADDWEVEEKKVEITLQDLADAWKRAWAGKNFNFYETEIKDIAKELGLIE